MAITLLDSGSYNLTDNAVNNISYTVSSGSNRVLVVAAGWAGGLASPNVLYVRWNGVDLTRVASSTSGSSSGADLWLLVNPTAGSYTLSILYGNGAISNTKASVYTFSGVSQTTPTCGSGTNNLPLGSSNNWYNEVTFTPTGVPGMIVDTARFDQGGSETPQSGQTQNGRSSYKAYSSSGSQTLRWGYYTGFLSQNTSMSVVALNEQKSIDVSDTETTSEALSVVPNQFAQQSDLQSVSDSASLTSGTVPNTELSVHTDISSYKWLSDRLQYAQEQPAVRPYFKTVIKDDLIVPNQILSNVGITNGSAVTSPDGHIFATGKDVNGYLSVWKLSDASSTWTGTVLDTSYRNDLNSAISVSEYINGTYTIDIYYFAVSGGNTIVMHKTSSDGGTTWVAGLTTNSTGLTNTDVSYISAGKPLLQDDLTVKHTFFYTKTVSSTYDVIAYQTSTGSTFGGETQWSAKRIDNYDWKLGQFDVEYANKKHYVVFSGYHKYQESTNGNYSIYLTSLSTVDSTWSDAVEVLSSLSASTLNQNTFSYPMLNKEGDKLYLVCRGVSVDSIESGSIVNTIVNYYILTTEDYENFTYPTPIIFSDGTVFSDTVGYDFVPQGDYFYLLGNGKRWQYKQNDITADITEYISACSVTDIGNGASSISIKVANDNNQWYGNSPTLPGYQAIAKDRKVFLSVGYYNNLGNPEAVPRSIFYIDDIQQNVTYNKNDLTITGRDYKKKLKTLISRYTYTYQGIQSYIDICDGSKISDWTQTKGTWTNYQNAWVTTQAGGSTPSHDTNKDYLLVLSKSSILTDSSLLAVSFMVPTYTDQYVDIYPFYQDANNWLRIRFTNVGDHSTVNATVTTSVNGTTEDAYGTTATALSGGAVVPYPLIVKRFDNYNFTFEVFTPNNLYNSNNTLVWSTNDSGIYTGTIKNAFKSGAWTRGTIAFGSRQNSGGFSNIKFIQYNQSQSVDDMYKKILAKCGLTNVKTENEIDETFSADTWTGGTHTIDNRQLTVSTGNLAYKATTIGNGEIEFEAKFTPTIPANDYSFETVFRMSNYISSTRFDGYTWKNYKTTEPDSGVIKSSSFRYHLDTIDDNMVSSSCVDFAHPIFSSAVNNLNIDFTQWNKYKLVMSDGFMYGFINDYLMIAWNDNNVSGVYNSGYFGFKTTNGTVTVRNLTSGSFWNQLNVANINTGDDIESVVGHMTEIQKTWHYSDMLGRPNFILLKSTDTPDYTYEGAMTSTGTDHSDKEYINQITIAGNGVMAIARDEQSISATGKVRDMTISDYKITVYSDALARAQYELINQNRFNDQNSVKQRINCGSEIFDVVTIKSTGDNSTGTNQDLRIFNQTLSIGGGNNSTGYSMNISTGNI